jgi:hypothetical protein
MALFEAAEALKTEHLLSNESYQFNDSNLLDDKDLIAFDSEKKIEFMMTPST